MLTFKFGLLEIGMIVAGLAIFLFGIQLMSEGLKKVSGERFKNFINKFSSTPIKGVAVGAVFTAIIQSSSGTTALVIGLIRAGMMSLTQAVGIMIGANIGTTATAFIMSLPVFELSPFVLIIGTGMALFIQNRKGKIWGEFLFGFASIFFGMLLMKEQLSTLTTLPEFTQLITSLNSNIWLGLLIGIVATAILQSSSAVVGILIVLYSSTGGQLDVIAVLPIIFGANIGTTITAVFASIGGSTPAKRAAVFHILFNVIGTVLFMIIITPFASLITYFGNHGISPSLQIAFAHLFFNLTTAILILPILKPCIWLVTKIVPGRSSVDEGEVTIQALDHSAIREFPSAALDIAKNQAIKMSAYGLRMLHELENYFISSDEHSFKIIINLEAGLDKIDRQLTEYLIKVDQGDLTKKEITIYGRIIRAIKDIERIGDYSEKLATTFQKMKDKNEKLDKENYNEILYLLNEAQKCHHLMVKVFKDSDEKTALELIELKRKLAKEINTIYNKYINYEIENKIEKIQFINLVYPEVLSNIERIFAHCSNIAKLYITNTLNLKSTNITPFDEEMDDH